MTGWRSPSGRDSQTASELLRSQGGHTASSPFRTPPASFLRGLTLNCSTQCCRQSVQRSGRACLLQRLCAGFGCGCASRGRWETFGSGDKWPSTLSWRFDATRKRMGQSCAQFDAGRNARIPNSPGVLDGGDGQRKRIIFFCNLQRPKFAEFPNRRSILACAATKAFAQSLLEQRGGKRVDGPTPWARL